MVGWIGYAVPFSFFGPSVAFIVFAVVLVIFAAIRDILSYQNIIW